MIRALVMCCVVATMVGCSHTPGNKELLRRCPSGSSRIVTDADSNTYIVRVVDDYMGHVYVYVTPVFK